MTYTIPTPAQEIRSSAWPLMPTPGEIALTSAKLATCRGCSTTGARDAYIAGALCSAVGMLVKARAAGDDVKLDRALRRAAEVVLADEETSR